MCDDSSDELEKELEEQLERKEQGNPFSKPRQRLEAAKAMAEGVASLECNVALGSYYEDTGEKTSGGPLQKDNFETSINTMVKDANHSHEDSRDLIQILSDATADNCEWKRLREISFESQYVLAEMNATLGSLQQWQKHREVNTVGTKPGERTLESTQGRTESRGTFLGESGDGGEEDPLLELWQEHQYRAEQAIERLRNQVRSARRPCSSDLVEKAKQQPQDLNRVVEEEERGEDRAAEIRRDVESLQIQQWIEDVRAEACDSALKVAGEACEGVWSETDSVRDIETKLVRFTDELDSLLLRVDGCDSGSQGLASNEVNEATPESIPTVPLMLNFRSMAHQHGASLQVCG